jgi:probable rRNA maturation factor
MFEVNFLNDKNMKIMNNKYRKINKTTDVISFALHDFKKFKTDLLGEIFIGIDTAKKDAKKLKISLQKEINLLFIHGLLHLLGYDHNNKKKEKIMFKLQNEILEYA